MADSNPSTLDTEWIASNLEDDELVDWLKGTVRTLATPSGIHHEWLQQTLRCFAAELASRGEPPSEIGASQINPLVDGFIRECMYSFPFLVGVSSDQGTQAYTLMDTHEDGSLKCAIYFNEQFWERAKEARSTLRDLPCDHGLEEDSAPFAAANTIFLLFQTTLHEFGHIFVHYFASTIPGGDPKRVTTPVDVNSHPPWHNTGRGEAGDALSEQFFGYQIRPESGFQRAIAFRPYGQGTGRNLEGFYTLDNQTLQDLAFMGTLRLPLGVNVLEE